MTRGPAAWVAALGAGAVVLRGVLGCAPGAEGIADPSPAACATCHAQHAAAWAGSAHARSGASPVFQALVARARTVWGAGAADRCVTCHLPGLGGAAEVDCVTCHAATGHRAPRDGALRVDTERGVAGPYPDPERTTAHGSRPSGFLRSADLCGTCHEVTGPGLFREPTLSEHAASPAAAAGLTCADCHMPPLPPGPGGGAASRPLNDHRVVGVSAPWGLPTAEADATRARSVALLQRALDLTLDAPPGASRRVRLRVTNVGAGHAVPTGVAMIRRLWVEVTARDATGAVIARLGALAPDGRPTGPPAPIELGDQPMRAGVAVALLTDADSIAPRHLVPGDAAEATLTLPSAPAGPLRVEATLRFRSVRAVVLDALGLGHRLGEVPALDVWRAELTLP